MEGKDIPQCAPPQLVVRTLLSCISSARCQALLPKAYSLAGSSDRQ